MAIPVDGLGQECEYLLVRWEVRYARRNFRGEPDRKNRQQEHIASAIPRHESAFYVSAPHAVPLFQQDRSSEAGRKQGSTKVGPYQSFLAPPAKSGSALMRAVALPECGQLHARRKLPAND